MRIYPRTESYSDGRIPMNSGEEKDWDENENDDAKADDDEDEEDE
jgi:hypothetical protein